MGQPPPLADPLPLSEQWRHEQETRTALALVAALAPELRQIAERLDKLTAAVEALNQSGADQPEGSP